MPAQVSSPACIHLFFLIALLLCPCPCPYDALPPCSLLHDTEKDSGLLPVLGRAMRGFNPKLQPRSHAADMMQVGWGGTGM